VPTKAKEPLPTIDEHFTYQPTAPPQPIAPVFTNSMSSMHVGSNGMASIYPSSASLPYSTYDSQSSIYNPKTHLKSCTCHKLEINCTNCSCVKNERPCNSCCHIQKSGEKMAAGNTCVNKYNSRY